MKQMLLFLVAVLLIAGCRTKESREEKTATGEMEQFKSVINGNWYETKYIEEVSKTKSPYRSQNLLADMVELYIDVAKAVEDTLEVGAPGIHEGTNFRLFFEEGLAPNSVKTDIDTYLDRSDFYEIGYAISTKDTTLMIYHYDNKKKLLGVKEYKKSPASSVGPLQYMINKVLFAGTYNAVDSSGSAFSLSFSNDGKVTGMPGAKEYYVLADFVAGPENNLDAVYFDIEEGTSKCYTYEFKGDTIDLYTINETEEHINLMKGELQFRLVRQ